MGIGEILSGLVKPVTDLYANRQERKRQESEAQATQQRILTEAAAADSAVAGQLAMVSAQNANNTWKDEYALITITAPYWVSFILVLASSIGPFDYNATEIVKGMFEPMAAIPEYWQDTFKVSIWSALGITGYKKIFRS